jgi:hypothetical protein
VLCHNLALEKCGHSDLVHYLSRARTLFAPASASAAAGKFVLAIIKKIELSIQKNDAPLAPFFCGEIYGRWWAENTYLILPLR